ncbi:ubiquinol-cytochrome c reductase iron-sulfur subunit [Spirulina subsalsa]|uniref:QcrA and Rieske domain-containing protein n=1 Tax=Spirulina subsalsa TaxID=54311 RepID=UPI0002FA304E|nr:ubiquinol-cytochrome c reductase iron-sulfur subunit [Spirulina subsalsa]
MNRRDFLNWIGVGFVASFLPVAIAACSESEETTTATPGEFQGVGTVTALNAEGHLLDESSPIGSISILKNPTNPEELLAVNPTCTHNGCTVDWNREAGKYICPCHGAEYSPEGEVLQGPAMDSLPTYEVKVEGDEILARII